ncbi:IS5 family transposase [Pseudarthrobacter albicanus]|uniref:IS5 family transposase n=1 Tax=Pseudarthrobacter albicanus TaxID=2823873 RepID=UPI001BA5EF1B|nr:IS5 family transposase [Pseudarthrobacter albicanus]
MAPFHAGVPRRERRYPTDITDAQWGLIDALLPDPGFIKGAGGRPEARSRRQIVDAILYMVDNGIKWRAMPADFPPHSTVFKYFTRWEAAGATGTILDTLRGRVRLAEGRNAAPTAAVIDSASVRGAETVGAASRGYDAGKKVNGRKRHIAVDTMGLLLCVLVTGAGVQDRDGATPLLEQLAASFRRIRLVWADGGYAGKLVIWAAQTLDLAVTIVKRSDKKGFHVLPRRWVVERTLAWIARHRRCVRDYERLPAHHEAMVRWSMTRITAKRLANRV